MKNQPTQELFDNLANNSLQITLQALAEKEAIIKIWKNRAIQLSIKTKYCFNCFKHTINTPKPNGMLCFNCEQNKKEIKYA